jgi:hypothetical protein
MVRTSAEHQWTRKPGFSKSCVVSDADKESNYWLAGVEEWAPLRLSGTKTFAYGGTPEVIWSLQTGR